MKIDTFDTVDAPLSINPEQRRRIDILTLFPDMLKSYIETSIVGRAQAAGHIEISLYNLRDWATDKHNTVDDSPYGGGPGMVLKVDVVDRALHDLKKSKVKSQKSKLQIKTTKTSPYVILMTPQGKPFSQARAQEFTQHEHLILIAGHYEGFDERIRTLVDDEISIGDYVLTGGELPSLVITDAVVRLLPGVLGKDTSSLEESFSDYQLEATSYQLLEYPQYTRPESYLPTSVQLNKPLAVPEILKSGHHAEISKWRQGEALKRTKTRRPDLIDEIKSQKSKVKITN